MNYWLLNNKGHILKQGKTNHQFNINDLVEFKSIKYIIYETLYHFDDDLLYLYVREHK